MQVVKSVPANTFVFTEKDLPGYNPRPREADTFDGGLDLNGTARIDPRPGFQDRAKKQLQNSGRNKKWHPYQRRTIPSKANLTSMNKSILKSSRADCNCWFH